MLLFARLCLSIRLQLLQQGAMKVPLPVQFSACAYLCILALSSVRACRDDCKACTKRCEDTTRTLCLVESLNADRSDACGAALDYHYDCGIAGEDDDDDPPDCKEVCSDDVTCIAQVQLFSVLTVCTRFHPRPARCCLMPTSPALARPDPSM